MRHEATPASFAEAVGKRVVVSLIRRGGIEARIDSGGGTRRLSHNDSRSEWHLL